MADTTLILGLGGIAGTVIGTVAGAYISARATTSVDLARQRREARQETSELQMAIRMIHADLLLCEGTLNVVLKQKRWFPRVHALPKSAWELHGPILARQVDSQAAWNDLEFCFAQLTNIQRLSRDETAVDDTLVSLITMTRDAVTDGRKTLQALSRA